MAEDTQQVEKKNASIRKFIEANIGKAIMTSLPVLITAMAYWIVDIQAEVAVIAAKVTNTQRQEQNDAAQWEALLTTNEKMKALEIEVRVNQKLLYLMTETEIDLDRLRVERLTKDHDEPVPEAEGNAPEKRARPRVLLPYFRVKPRHERLEEYKQEQMQQQMPMNAKR